MQKITRNILFGIFVILNLWSCTQTREVEPGSLGTNYFPLNVGAYRIYQIDGVKYFSYNDSIEFSYQIKEHVVDSFTNLEGGISYKIQRDKKYEENEAWEIDSIWTARKDGYSAITVENNVPFVKLTFPLEENKKWDGNRFNDAEKDEYEMIDVDKGYSTEFDTFGKSVTIIQEDFPINFEKKIFKREVYAEGIGLVEKENTTLFFLQEEFWGLEKINSGIKYFQYLTEHGKD